MRRDLVCIRNEIVIVVSCQRCNGNAKCKETRSYNGVCGKFILVERRGRRQCGMRQTNRKYGRHLSIQIQSILNELINWSTLLMVNKLFYMEFELQSYLSIIYFEFRILLISTRPAHFQTISSNSKQIPISHINAFTVLNALPIPYSIKYQNQCTQNTQKQMRI